MGFILEPKDAAKIPFIHKDIKTGKQFLVNPEEEMELCLPGKDDPKGNGCDDWVIVSKEGVYLLASEKNKQIKERDVEVVMRGRKAKQVTDESRLEAIKEKLSGDGGNKGGGHQIVARETDEQRRERILKRAQEMAKEKMEAQDRKKKEEEAQKENKRKKEEEEKRKKEEDKRKKEEDKRKKEEEDKRKEEEDKRKQEEEDKRKTAEEEERLKEEAEAAAMAETILKGQSEDQDSKKGKSEKSAPAATGPSSPLRPRAHQHTIDEGTDDEKDVADKEREQETKDLSWSAACNFEP